MRAKRAGISYYASVRSFLAILLLTAVPVFAQPLALQEERPVSAVEYGEHAEGARPQIASSGDGYLAVWTDNRGVWATRLTAEGAVLDPLGIYLGRRHARGVIWSGAFYVVLVTDAVLALNPDGTKQAEYSLHPFLYADDREVRLATNGTSVLVVGQGDALRLQLDGKPIGIVKLAEKSFFENVGVASNGNDYVVAWTANRGVKMQRVTASGVAVAPAVVLDAEGFVPHVAIAGNGTSYVVVWATTSRTLFAQEIGAELRTLSARRTVDSATYPDFLEGPRVEWRGGDYVLTYARNRSVLLATRLSSHADSIAAPIVYADSSNHNGMGDIAVNGSGGGAFVWIDPRGVRAGLFDAQSIAGVSPLRTNAQVSRAAHAQDMPAVVTAGNGIIIGWMELTAAGRKLRLSAPGRNEPVRIEQVNAYSFWLFADDSFLWIVWTEALTLNVLRYTHALVPIDAQPWRFALPAYLAELAVTLGDRGLIAVSQTGTAERELAATTIRIEGGALVATETDVVTGNDDLPDRAPVVAWSGSEYVVAWVHLKGTPWWQFPQAVPEDILAVRVTRDGVRVDSVPIVVEQRGPTFLWPLNIAPAIGGGVVLAWSDPLNSYATIFRGQPLPDVYNLGEHRTFRHAGLRAVPNGYLLFQSDAGQKAYDVSLRVQRLTSAFVPDGAPLTITGEPNAKILGYSFTTIGHALVLAYLRETTEPAYTGQRRGFVRHGELPTGRRRAVR